MSEVTLDSLLFILVGLMFVGLSIPLIQKKVPPNKYYGFRTRKTLSNPEIWYEVNRVSGNDLLVAGTLISMSSLTMLVLAQSWSARNVVITLMSVMVLSLCGVAWRSYMLLRRS